MFEVAKHLKEMGANRIFIFATFGLFCNGLDKFDEMYEKKVFDKIFTTNLIYGSPALKERAWYHSVNMCKYVSLLIDTLNHDKSISPLLKPIDRINKLLSTLPPERRN